MSVVGSRAMRQVVRKASVGGRLHRTIAPLQPASLALCCLVAVLACSDGGTRTTNIAVSSYDGPGAGVTLQSAGLVVEMDPSVRFVSDFRSETGKPDVRIQTMNGMPFELRPDGFTLGGHTFDGLVSGDRVLITADGILVNGEKRWELPGA